DLDRLQHRDAQVMARLRIGDPDPPAAFGDTGPDLPVDLSRRLPGAINDSGFHAKAPQAATSRPRSTPGRALVPAADLQTRAVRPAGSDAVKPSPSAWRSATSSVATAAQESVSATTSG